MAHELIEEAAIERSAEVREAVGAKDVQRRGGQAEGQLRTFA